MQRVKPTFYVGSLPLLSEFLAVYLSVCLCTAAVSVCVWPAATQVSLSRNSLYMVIKC